MTTIRRRPRSRTREHSSVMERFWAGELPPPEAPTEEGREEVIGAVFFSWCDPKRPSVPWEHHPLQPEWLAWAGPS